MKIQMLFGNEPGTLEFPGTEGLKSALAAVYAQRKDILGVSIHDDADKRLSGRLVFKEIRLRPSPMAKVAFESRDYSLGTIMNLAGSVMTFPDMEVRELIDNLYVRINNTLWAIVGEQTVFYAEKTGECEYRL